MEDLDFATLGIFTHRKFTSYLIFLFDKKVE